MARERNLSGGHARWLWQIVGIENKGHAAFLAGVLRDACPYQTGYHNQNGAGGSVQSQRRKAWMRGWDLAKQQQQEEADNAMDRLGQSET